MIVSCREKLGRVDFGKEAFVGIVETSSEHEPERRVHENANEPNDRSLRRVADGRTQRGKEILRLFFTSSQS